MRPGAARLLVEAPVVLGDGVGIENAVPLLQRIALGEIVADEGGVERAVDHRMRDMDARGPELARHALRQRPQAMLGAGEGGEAGAAAHARRGAGEEDGAALARDHDLGDLAAHQEPGEAAHLPHLEIDARRRLADPKANIGADVEHGDLDRPQVALDAQHELGHLLFLARIGAERLGRAAGSADRFHQRRQLVAVAAHDRGDEALLGEAARDGAAQRVAGADHQRDLLLHAIPPYAAGSAFLR